MPCGCFGGGAPPKQKAQRFDTDIADAKKKGSSAAPSPKPQVSSPKQEQVNVSPQAHAQHWQTSKHPCLHLVLA
jgi:hypothetical protein